MIRQFNDGQVSSPHPTNRKNSSDLDSTLEKFGSLTLRDDGRVFPAEKPSQNNPFQTSKSLQIENQTLRQEIEQLKVALEHSQRFNELIVERHRYLEERLKTAEKKNFALEWHLKQSNKPFHLC
mmetsp:Transcript_12215/g.18272  ORF Transcript_12215/g.18272 Transcript_12215/m.18272 type:complete len:124 (+) Transcript_12215:87-458(+)